MKKYRILITLFVIFSALTIAGCIDKLTPPTPEKVATPYFSMEESHDENSKYVSILCNTEGVTIFYTLDYSNPNTNSEKYVEPIEITKNTYIIAKAYKKGWIHSDQRGANYTFKVKPVSFSPEGGIFGTPPTITLECPTQDAEIYYTIFDSNPSAVAQLYEGPFVLESSAKISAYANKEEWMRSVTTQNFYSVAGTQNEMIYVPGGTFTMGRTSGSGGIDEFPFHSVTLDPFYIAKYPVTYIEYYSIISPASGSDGLINLDLPAGRINWNAAIKYCNLRSIAEELTPVYSLNGETNPNEWGAVPAEGSTMWNHVVCDWDANGYRLPTEAEWEYAARGGTNTPDYIYSGSDDVLSVAWHDTNSGGASHNVGGKTPNLLGLYDMSGNIREWCWDWYQDDYYANSPSENPRGPSTGYYRVLRGGYWNSNAADCRVSKRAYHPHPYSLHLANGLRVCRSAK